MGSEPEPLSEPSERVVVSLNCNCAKCSICETVSDENITEIKHFAVDNITGDFLDIESLPST